MDRLNRFYGLRVVGILPFLNFELLILNAVCYYLCRGLHVFVGYQIGNWL